MKKLFCVLATTFLLPLTGYPALNYSVLFGVRGGYQDTDFLEYLNKFMKEGWVLSGNFIGNIEWDTRYITAVLEVDTREISEVTLEEEGGTSYFVDVRLKKSYLINELFLNVHPAQGLSIYLGKREFEEMFGFISDTYLMGASVFLDLYRRETAPLVFSLGIYKAEKSEEFFDHDFFAPIVRFSMDYRFSLWEFLSFSTMFFYEEYNLFGSLLNTALQQVFQPILQGMITKEEEPLKRFYLQEVLQSLLAGPFTSSKGYFMWFNLYGKKYIKSLCLSAGMSFEIGSTDLVYRNIFTGRTTPLSVDLFSYEGFLKMRYEGWKRAEPFLTFIYMSGDKTPFDLSDGYHTFVAPYQYVTEMSLFYQGGINAHFSTGSFVPSGLIGYGNISLVIGVDADLFFNLTLLQAFLFSAVSPQPINTELGKSEVGMVYGYETNVILEKEITDWLMVLFEFDAFFTGDFFLNQESMFRAIAGVDVAF